MTTIDMSKTQLKTIDGLPVTDYNKSPQGGMKYDGGKIGANMIFEYFADALWEVAKVADMGAKKYARASWKTVPNGYERYSDAKARHFLANAKGEDYDEESGLLHQAHEAWNTLALLQMKLESLNKKNGE